MGSAETVKKVQEGMARLDGGQVRHGAQIHRLLGRGGGQHAEADHAAAHHIGMVTENGQAMDRDGTGGDMEHAGQKLTGDFIHRRDHQQQTLGRCIGGVQGAGLGLHLNDFAWCSGTRILSCPILMFRIAERASEN
ncbi:hypothetical protein SDC9_126026 [bioreactor metagenome]|uniref:Uncharacterized protein n=1 Tax=bioreactor metagenome TaxID=1076179 RepID=A0A645CPJ4_9ZZZZ